ncbi:MAG TPA: VWA domain-containing protein [Gammaproteobacteria bacterium]|nr:VWA domain-containing protein [Gammaproteobacteria bacterium]
MARRRRENQIISMSFLDIMSCGFGAVVLFFMIINSQVPRDMDAVPQELQGETTRLDFEILEARKNLVLARNTMEELEDERARASTRIEQITALIEKLKIELAKHDKDTLAKVERVEKLQSDIERLEEEKKRLLAEERRRESGMQVRSFTGEGDRQYLTGLKVGGKHILVLVDSSASMLDRRIINILRRRNMSDADKLRSLKWRQAVASVDWLSAQFPPQSMFQIYTFNTEPHPVLKGSDGVWLEVGDGEQLDEAIRILRRTVPQDGTNMLDAYKVINRLNPKPDNVILLVDGLPTMNSKETDSGFVTGQQRLKYHYEAEKEVPSGVPVNVLLYPMEGDYNAAIAYWLLAYRTGGSFMSISRDWP